MKQSSHDKKRIKYRSVLLDIADLKKIVEKDRRRKIRELVAWDGGVGGRWHEESVEMLLRKHNVLRKRRRKRYR